MASTTWRMPSMSTRSAWRRVCRVRPWRGVDEQHGEIRCRGAGRHVARILLVAGRIGDDEGARLGREEAVGDIDGDALLALGGEPVDEEREVEAAAGGAVPARGRFQGRDLIVEELFEFVQQAPDEGRLSVVD